MMIRSACWNITGVNGLLKIQEMKHFIRQYDLQICTVVDTKVRRLKASAITQMFAVGLSLAMNHHVCGIGRIWLGWDSEEVILDDLSMEEQIIHCEATSRVNGLKSFLSSVYRNNVEILRRRLLDRLLELSSSLQAASWAVLGYCNTLRSPLEILVHDLE
ncbi:hypothetical protein Nepgr_030858 [Nepenthes gracilis]|uniref:Uncharacterized protein n=1 Tax=Nepenthes gracilis TaxID=150966 RepID=A0AAD3TFD1_NEPGR|nr:hypothetical protein Nepgr_030858 [Nepenthes gracilis]